MTDFEGVIIGTILGIVTVIVIHYWTKSIIDKMPFDKLARIIEAVLDVPEEKSKIKKKL